MSSENGAATAIELLELSLAQHLEHAVILLDGQARVIAWYPGATKTFGYDADEMIGQTLQRLFTTEDLARGDMEWEFRAAASYGKSEDDRWMVRKDGIQFWASGIVTALHDASGRLAGFVKVVRDRTDVRTHMDMLQARVAHASRQQHEKHVLLGTLAHELRNPLAPLRSAAQLIRMATPDKPRVASYVQIIERQIRFLDDLLKDLIESTRVGVGKAKLHYSTFELRTVIDAAIETCSAVLRDRRQAVDVLIPDTLRLEADAVRLQQVIVNLITNSSKFSPAGTTIWIKATVDADQMVFRVEDHGQGIPSDILPRIFELFTQADAAPERAPPSAGLGLGLGIVKSIVEMHGGTVQARSEGVGQGAEIIIRVPLRAPPQPTGAALPRDEGTTVRSQALSSGSTSISRQ
jgi:two-component system CheB/CheR fusion protein